MIPLFLLLAYLYKAKRARVVKQAHGYKKIAV